MLITPSHELVGLPMTRAPTLSSFRGLGELDEASQPFVLQARLFELGEPRAQPLVLRAQLFELAAGSAEVARPGDEAANGSRDELAGRGERCGDGVHAVADPVHDARLALSVPEREYRERDRQKDDEHPGS